MRTLIRLVLGALLTGWAMNVWAAPILQIDQYEFNFGTVFQGESVSHAFTFANRGDQPLNIHKVRSSCGCTAALVSSQELQPGEEGEVKANFDSTRFRGAISKTIYLYTNDTAQPVAQLFIKGIVKPLLNITPQQINLGNVTPNKPYEASLMVVNQSQEVLTLEAPTTTAQELTASLETTELVAGQASKLHIKLIPKPGQPRFSGYVLVKVAGASLRELRIPVYAMVTP